ncbi:hypothetical protein C8R47DRAFT_82857 [Mycena vitilis]|nr:hypothetical protein C8R47DRAFT_82857 [Mycena vitilis]
MSDGVALPQELIDHIIDHLFDDVQSLRACSLVSSSFFPSSRTNIFSHLRVGPLDHPIDELRDILGKSPYLIPRVHSLHLFDHILRRHSWIEEWSESVAPGVAEFSRTLVGLQQLIITIEAGFVHWANISEDLTNTIHFTLSARTLTCLELTALYGLPFTLLAHCPALKSVTLKWVTFDERAATDFAPTLAECEGSPLTLLTHLSLDLDARVLELLSHWILLPESPLKLIHLKSLVCTMDIKSDYITIQRLLDECTQSLEHFQLKHMEGMFELSELVHLRSLTIDTIVPLQPRVQWLMSSVSLPPQPIDLTINMESESGSSDDAKVSSADTTLAKFRSIASVTLIIWPPEPNPNRESERARELVHARNLVDVHTDFAPKMPLLSAKGRLRVLRSPQYGNASSKS